MSVTRRSRMSKRRRPPLRSARTFCAATTRRASARTPRPARISTSRPCFAARWTESDPPPLFTGGVARGVRPMELTIPKTDYEKLAVFLQTDSATLDRLYEVIQESQPWLDN